MKSAQGRDLTPFFGGLWKNSWDLVAFSCVALFLEKDICICLSVTTYIYLCRCVFACICITSRKNTQQWTIYCIVYDYYWTTDSILISRTSTSWYIVSKRGRLIYSVTSHPKCLFSGLDDYSQSIVDPIYTNLERQSASLQQQNLYLVVSAEHLVTFCKS